MKPMFIEKICEFIHKIPIPTLTISEMDIAYPYMQEVHMPRVDDRIVKAAKIKPPRRTANIPTSAAYHSLSCWCSVCLQKRGHYDTFNGRYYN